MFAKRTTTSAVAVLALAGVLAAGVGFAGVRGEITTLAQPRSAGAPTNGPGSPALGPGGADCWGPDGWNSDCGSEPPWGPGMMGPGHWDDDHWGPGMMGPGYWDDDHWGPGMMGPGYWDDGLAAPR